MKNILGLLLGASMLTGCATTATKSLVIERADGLTQTPDWAHVSNSTFDSNGKRYFVGYVEVDGDARKSAALNMSDEKALSEPMRSLVDHFSDQSKLTEDLNTTTSQRIISSTRGFRSPMPSLRIVKRYWEVIETGPVTTQLRAYSLAEVPILEFEKALMAIRNQR